MTAAAATAKYCYWLVIYCSPAVILFSHCVHSFSSCPRAPNCRIGSLGEGRQAVHQQQSVPSANISGLHLRELNTILTDLSDLVAKQRENDDQQLIEADSLTKHTQTAFCFYSDCPFTLPSALCFALAIVGTVCLCCLLCCSMQCLLIRGEC